MLVKSRQGKGERKQSRGVGREVKGIENGQGSARKQEMDEVKGGKRRGLGEVDGKWLELVKSRKKEAEFPR
eukprot:754245-Hanusia_phi.AAC.1